MPRIAVVTPYHKEPTETLRQCHQSVLSQEMDVDHFLVADGFPNADAAGWRVQHVTLPRAHGDFGNTPRAVGSLLADSQGYDFVAYLDADNWYHGGHLQSLVRLHGSTGAPVCSSLRTYHSPDGAWLKNVEEAQEMDHSHVDTSCYLIHRNAFEALNVWARIPRQTAMVGDRIFKAYLESRRYGFAFSDLKTVAYRTLWRTHYASAGIPPPHNVRDLTPEHVHYLLSVEGAREIVARLGIYPA